MPDDLGPVGTGPQRRSEEAILRGRHERSKVRARWAREKRIVEAAEELEAFASKGTYAPVTAEDVKLDRLGEMAELLSKLYEAVRRPVE